MSYGDCGGALPIWHIGITEFVKTALLWILAAARSGAVCVACIYPKMVENDRSKLVQVQSGAHREAGDIGSFELSVVVASIQSPH